LARWQLHNQSTTPLGLPGIDLGGDPPLTGNERESTHWLLVWYGVDPAPVAMLMQSAAPGHLQLPLPLLLKGATKK